MRVSKEWDKKFKKRFKTFMDYYYVMKALTKTCEIYEYKIEENDEALEDIIEDIFFNEIDPLMDEVKKDRNNVGFIWKRISNYMWNH